ncbi:MAG: hypothetical protein WCQ77_10480 [Planctomycetota bacterium]
MPSIHSIRLGAAWESPSPAIWRRRFGRPAGLEAGDLVVLVVSQPFVAVEITVNDARLPPLEAGAPGWSCDITPLLLDRNELVIVLSQKAGHWAARDRHGRSELPVAIGIVTLEIVAGDHGGEGPAT